MVVINRYLYHYKYHEILAGYESEDIQFIISAVQCRALSVCLSSGSHNKQDMRTNLSIIVTSRTDNDNTQHEVLWRPGREPTY